MIEILIVSVIIAVALSVIITSTKRHRNIMRLKRATQEFIADLQWAQEVAKQQSEPVFVVFEQEGGEFTGRYTIMRGGEELNNPMWGNTRRERIERYRKAGFRLIPWLPINEGTITFSAHRGFAEPAATITLRFKGREKVVEVTRLGGVREIR